MTRPESEKCALAHPDMVAYCAANLFKSTCPDCCPHYELCRSLDYTDKYGTFPVYPGFIVH